VKDKMIPSLSTNGLMCWSVLKREKRHIRHITPNKSLKTNSPSLRERAISFYSYIGVLIGIAQLPSFLLGIHVPCTLQ
jgi:hypothetical protein